MNPDFENYSNLRQQIRRSLTNWRDRLTRLGSDSLYLFLSAAAFAPAAAAAAQGQPAGMELMVLLGNMGSNLLANVVQKFRDAPDEAAAMAMLQEALAAAPGLQAELDAVLSRLETLTVAQEALPAAERDWFTETIRAELDRRGAWPQFQAQLMAVGAGAQAIKTGKQSTVIAGDVNIILNPEGVAADVAAAFWQRLTAPAQDLRPATASYLTYLINKYQYLDFRGMGVSDRVPLRLPLLGMYVPLQARVEMPDGDTWARHLNLAGRQVSEEEAEAMGRRLSKPQPVLTLLQEHPGLIILGDPGAGKTTFLKYLALQLALGDGVGLGQRLPLLLPLSAYANELARRDLSLDAFIANHYRNLVGRELPVGEMLAEALQQGRALLLLDGLDEVKETGRRRLVVDRVMDFFALQQQRGNKFILTSRIVGYREVRPTITGLAECTLVDFGLPEIEQFIAQWTTAIEQAAQSQASIAAAEAAREKRELLQAVANNPGVRQLASNPLLLTILALMKRQGVTLPERRVELYEQYVRTLLKHWNLARGLDRAAERDLDVIETVRILAPLALWMHETSPGVGLVKQQKLQRKLTQIYTERGAADPEKAARQLLQDAHSDASLLVERGQGSYGFIHLTFQEYLAAVGVAAKGQQGVQPIVDTLAPRLDDDNWREVTLLSIGYLGIVQQRDEAAGETLRLLVKQQPGTPGQAEIMAGEAVADAWPGGVSLQCRTEIVNALLAAMRDGQRVKPLQRAKAGQTLARLGDTRYEVMDVGQMQFCYVPPGPFWMGSDTGNDDEKPQHWVEMPHSYWLGKFPVTNAQYAAFMADDGYANETYWTEAKTAKVWQNGKVKGYWEPEPRGQPRQFGHPFDLPNHPVVGVTWYEALAFTRWLTKHWHEQGWLPDKWTVRLPTEAEWEKAAQGSGQIPATPFVQPIGLLRAEVKPKLSLLENDPQSVYIWGAKADPNRANYKESGIGATSAVGCFPGGVSPYGVEEMAGNMWEWLQSKSKGYEYRADDGREEIDASNNSRILRGGYFGNNNDRMRCAFRYRRYSLGDFNGYGIRVCVSPFLSLL